MSHTCKFCGKRYSGSGAFPSDWGWGKKTTWSKISVEAGTETPQLMAYCSEKCRREAEGGQGGGGGGGSSSSESSSSGSDSDLSPGCSSVLGKIITGVFVILGLIVVLAVIFGKNENPNDPAVKMEKWHEHLEKRRAAFAEGLPEEGVEARGFKNYTWEEWQAREKKSRENSSEKEVKKDAKSLVDLWRAHQNKRGELLNRGIGTDAVNRLGFGSLSYDEFKARYNGKDVEAELKKLNARAEELIKERKSAATMPVKSAASARSAAAPVENSVRNEVAARKKAAAEARTKAETAAKAKTTVEVAKVSTGDSGIGQPNGTGNKASKDSKAIRIVVHGKGKTKDAAVRWALRDAVFKTVGTWVDSKSRIQENREKVVAQVKTITEADVPKFEVLETQEKDGGFVVKVRVSVSKKKIAPKFAEIFPDVFVIE